MGLGAGAIDAGSGADGLLSAEPGGTHQVSKEPMGTQPTSPARDQGEITVRVRYAETDRMGLLHHANYLVYFEHARTELLRQMGRSYKDVEDQGFFLVLAKIEVRYRQPARYDDLLTLRTTVTRTTPVRIEHRY